MDGSTSQNGRRLEYFKILTGKSAGKRLIGRPRRRWDDSIMMDL